MFQVLRISATPDDIPELEEEFSVLLATPQGGATLGRSNNATIIIQRNDAPYGSMQVFPRGMRQVQAAAQMTVSQSELLTSLL